MKLLFISDGTGQRGHMQYPSVCIYRLITSWLRCVL